MADADQSRTSRREILRRGLTAGAIPFSSSVLSACGEDDGAATGDFPTRPDTEKAQEEGSVTLYTSLDTEIVDQIIGAFKNEHGIEVEYYRGGSVDVTNKVLAEAEVNQIRADVVDASDVGGFLVMKDRELLWPYESPETTSIAEEFRDPQFHWVADRLTQAVIQYNTEKIPEGGIPEAWEDLSDPAFHGRLAYFSAANGDGAPRLYTLVEEFDWEILENFADNQPTRQTTPQVLTQSIERGEATVGFAQNDNIAWRSKLEGQPTDYFYPEEGVPTELGAVGIMAEAPNPNAALLFYDWWMGKSAQKLLVEGGKYSPRPDVQPPEGNPHIDDLRLWVLDYPEYADQRENVLDRMAEIFGGEWGA